MAVTAQKPAASGAIASKTLFADRVVDDLTSLDSRASTLETNTTDTWKTITLAAGWVGTLRVRRIGLNLMLLQSGLLTPGTKADNTNIGTLPVGYRPTNSMDVLVACNVTVAGGQLPHFNLAAAGAITCWGLTSATVASAAAVFAIDN